MWKLKVKWKLSEMKFLTHKFALKFALCGKFGAPGI